MCSFRCKQTGQKTTFCPYLNQIIVPNHLKREFLRNTSFLQKWGLPNVTKQDKIYILLLLKPDRRPKTPKKRFFQKYSLLSKMWLFRCKQKGQMSIFCHYLDQVVVSNTFKDNFCRNFAFSM